MKKSSNKQYAHALYEITKDKSGADLKQVLDVFVKLLVRDRKLKQSNNIIIEFEKFSKKQEGIVELAITSAHELDDKTVEHIKKVFGQKVEAVQDVDEDLIGGVRVKMEDKILDGSLKTQLVSLKKRLTS
jgi:F-type H+-transporting ATPase subunit delta